jgi:hypothetical protein
MVKLARVGAAAWCEESGERGGSSVLEAVEFLGARCGAVGGAGDAGSLNLWLADDERLLLHAAVLPSDSTTLFQFTRHMPGLSHMWDNGPLIFS